MQNFEKQSKINGLGVKGTFPPHLALICLTGSEKRDFGDGRQRAE